MTFRLIFRCLLVGDERFFTVAYINRNDTFNTFLVPGRHYVAVCYCLGAGRLQACSNITWCATVWNTCINCGKLAWRVIHFKYVLPYRFSNWVYAQWRVASHRAIYKRCGIVLVFCLLVYISTQCIIYQERKTKCWRQITIRSQLSRSLSNSLLSICTCIYSHITGGATARDRELPLVGEFSRDGQFYVVLCGTSVHLWTTYPFTVLATYARSTKVHIQYRYVWKVMCFWTEIDARFWSDPLSQNSVSVPRSITTSIYLVLCKRARVQMLWLTAKCIPSIHYLFLIHLLLVAYVCVCVCCWDTFVTVCSGIWTQFVFLLGPHGPWHCRRHVQRICFVFTHKRCYSCV